MRAVPRLVAATAVLVAALAACHSDPPHFTDAATDAGIDGAPPIDAPPIDALEAAPGRELTSSGGRVHGARYVLDVQIGHAAAQTPTVGAAHVVEGNAPVKP